jgi:hypothetical protein
VVNIPASTITEISYGQDVHRRVGAAIGIAVVSFGVGALMALTKSKKHCVGVTWGGPHLALFEMWEISTPIHVRSSHLHREFLTILIA